MNRLTLRTAAAVVLASFALTACQQQEDSSASANPEAKPGLSVAAGTLVLPAVAGNPGAAYFAISNAGENPAQISAIHVEGVARVEMHETAGGKMARIQNVPIQPGETVKFERGGKHAMLFDLGETLKPGGTTEMTVVFADGDKLSTPLAIRTAGDAGGGDAAMAGMEMH